MKQYLILIILLISHLIFSVKAQDVTYPYLSNSISLEIETQAVNMSYMDVPADLPNGKTVILFHGKNFNGYYWKDVIEFLKNKGFRVIAPDQIGWGKSSHPNIHYSFHLLAKNSSMLLDSLGIEKVIVIGHSTGGMLAARFALMYPDRVEKLILENPVGLEDYRMFVPYQALEDLNQKELKATYDSYKKYQMTYYPEWKPEYEQYVQAQAMDLNKNNFKEIAWSNALTYQMIYEQPVCYEFGNIKVPTLLIIGQADRTILGKDLLSDEVKEQHGQYPELGKRTHEQIFGSQLVEVPGVGHIPHIQNLPAFQKAVEDFLK